MKWITYVFLAFLLLACSKKTSIITTDSNDPRLKTISGTWYRIPYDSYYVSKYNRIKNDSAFNTMTFLDEKTLLFSFLDRPKYNGKRQYFIKGNFLYTENYDNKYEYSKLEILKISSDSLELRQRGIKDITEPFLCGNGEIFKISMKPAVFGYSKNSFSDFINQNADSLDSYSDGDRAAIQFDVNCEGKVCNVIHYENMYSKTKFAIQMKEIVKRMPDWQPGMQREKYVNFQFVKLFELTNNKIGIKEIR